VAGRFYARDADELRREVRGYTAVAGEKITAIGCVAPHAGYVYSGHVAGAVYGRLDLPRRFVILCPNHTGMGAPLAVMSEGVWQTPLGAASLDCELAAALKKEFDLLREDPLAHRAEHALEVQLPFLQALLAEFTFVPITVGVGRFEILQQLGEAMARVIAAQPERILIIASSDMNHYESDKVTRLKDGKAIQKLLDLDARGLHEVVTRENVSMCGFGPAVAMLVASRRLGARTAQLIKYATSGDISGERDAIQTLKTAQTPKDGGRSTSTGLRCLFSVRIISVSVAPEHAMDSGAQLVARSAAWLQVGH
jgi:AmmeMemoRadiSam system protein B